jgi:hypothetical protein
MIVVGQAIGSSDDQEENNIGQISDTTTSSTITTTSSPPFMTSNISSSQTATTQQTTTTQTEAITDGPPSAANFDIGASETKDAARGGIDPIELSEVENAFANIINFSIQYLFLSSAFFSVISLFYFMLFNNSELATYVNQSLKQAGFDSKITRFGKKWVITTNNNNFTMKLVGFRKLRMKFELPQIPDLDPREFGLRTLEHSVLTICDFEVLPMRMRVINMYLSEMD